MPSDFEQTTPTVSRVSIGSLGVTVTPLTADDVVAFVLTHAKAKTGFLIGNLNLHGVYMFHTNDVFREFCEKSDLVLVDGAPVAWAGGISGNKRIGSTDWLDALLPRAEGLRILAIGGTPRASAAAKQAITSSFPLVTWDATDGFAGSKMTPELIQSIRDSDLVLVGMGMPIQERWILEHSEYLQNKVVANVGGCFDYYAGTQHLAPRWMGRLGIEWVYRLAKNPSRLWHRYLVEPFKLAWVLFRKRVQTRG